MKNGYSWFRMRINFKSFTKEKQNQKKKKTENFFQIIKIQIVMQKFFWEQVFVFIL